MAPKLNASKGLVRTLHLQGRDRVLMPFPCFEHNARSDHQMSGAPILGVAEDLSSQVCGLVCRGWELPEGDDPLGYASLLWPALGLTTKALDTDENESRDMTLYELGKKGIVAVRGLDSITFDPANPQRISIRGGGNTAALDP